MIRFLPLLFLAAVVLEIASIIWVGGLIGIVPTLLCMVLGGLVGMRLIRSAGTTVAEALRSPVQARSPLKGTGGVAAARGAAGLLFLIPGFFSDALAVLVLFPPVRNWLASRFRVETYPGRPRDSGRSSQVIEVEAIDVTAEVEQRDQGKG